MKKSLSISNYHKMLERLYSMLEVHPEKFKGFEELIAEVENVKNRTIIINFKEIAEKLNRNPEELASFFFKDLSTNGMIDEDTKQLIIFGKFSFERVNMTLKYYIKKHVICPICSSVDTVVIKEGKALFLKCLACGATSSIVD